MTTENKVFPDFKVRHISWFEAFILAFIKGYVVCDSGYCYLFKKWRGKTYLIKELKPLQ